MELLFFPSVAERTFFQTFATFLIASNKGAGLPIFAKLGIISKEIRFSPEILEVVRINTLCFVMLMIIRAPLGFEVEDIEVIVLVTR